MALSDFTIRIRCAVCNRLRGLCTCNSKPDDSTPAQRAERYCDEHPNDQGCKIHDL